MNKYRGKKQNHEWYLCANCGHVVPHVRGMKVTEHAIDKWRKHNNSTKPNGKIARRLIAMCEEAEPLEHTSEGARLKDNIAHEAVGAKYRATSRLLFVIVDDIIVTVYPRPTDVQLHLRGLRIVQPSQAEGRKDDQ